MITPPPSGWFKAPHGNERLWIGLAVAWCLVLSAAMPYWHFRGRQNPSGETYKVDPADFLQRTQRFISAHQVGELNGVPIVEPPPGGDAYLVAQMWRFYPVLKLRVGQTYRLHVSSPDLQHGLAILPINVNFHVVPGYDHVITLTPTTTGVFPIICNEFCGIGHHAMTGRIIVE